MKFCYLMGLLKNLWAFASCIASFSVQALTILSVFLSPLLDGSTWKAGTMVTHLSSQH